MLLKNGEKISKISKQFYNVNIIIKSIWHFEDEK